MTQTEQIDIRQRMHEACARFYEAFDFMPERVIVYFAQKPHLPLSLVVEVPNHIGVIAIETYTNAKLEWNEFYLYSSKTGRVTPEELQPGPTLIKKMIESKGYAVLVSSRPCADFFYIFNWERHVFWPLLQVEYEMTPLALLKSQIAMVLENLAKEGNQ